MALGGFFKIDNAVLDLLPTIKPTGFAVYAYLCKCADETGHCFPSQETIGKVVGVKERQVRNILNTLEAVGLIRYKKAGASDGRRASYSVSRDHNNRQYIANNRQPITGNGTEYRQSVAENTGNTLPRNKEEQNPENKTQEGERASAPPPPPSDGICAYLAAQRLFHESFADELFRFHGGTPQGDLKTAYVEMLADWISHGKEPTPTQLKAAVDDAITYWKREGKKGSCTGFGPVKKALTDLLSVPLIETTTQTVTPNPMAKLPTIEERRAQIYRNRRQPVRAAA